MHTPFKSWNMTQSWMTWSEPLLFSAYKTDLLNIGEEINKTKQSVCIRLKILSNERGRREMGRSWHRGAVAVGALQERQLVSYRATGKTLAFGQPILHTPVLIETLADIDWWLVISYRNCSLIQDCISSFISITTWRILTATIDKVSPVFFTYTFL